MRHRRELLKLIGVSPIAAGAVQTNLAELISSPAVQAGVALTSMAHPTGPGESAAEVLKRILQKQAKELLKDGQRLNEAKKSARGGMFDADIAAMKSVSTINKQRLQMERDFEWESISDKGWDFVYDD